MSTLERILTHQFFIYKALVFFDKMYENMNEAEIIGGALLFADDKEKD